ncbi:helix-turn-helix domain-containing protein [Patescibacteria group bacterium]|nr:helix-turn-helix domain-containing protein [Patescibacteria group bacterium]
MLSDILSEYPPLLTVKQVAKIFQVTPLTIKRWGKKGILPPIRINSRGDRRYTKEQVLWLIGQRTGDKIIPSVNKKLYEAKEDSLATNNIITQGVAEKTTTPQHTF